MNSRVCIAVPTYRRQDQLFAVLHGLARLRIDADLDVEIVVFDNDAARSGEHVVTSLPVDYPIPVRYEVVPEPGLSSVRNGELTWAYAHAEYLAMIDDDEIPEPQWLHELMRVRRKTGADVVVGPVPVILPDEAPGWFGAWRSAEMPHPADGSPLRDGWTGNCLLHLPTMRTFDVSFDPTMNFSGGEDTLFFRQIRARGGTIAYAARATVWELMSADRVSLGFVVARHFRKGNTLARCDQRIHGDPVAIAVRVAKGCGLTAIGSFTALACALTLRNAEFVRSACDVARGVGMIAGLCGVSYEPYRRQI
jgi:glycosyltransferase involved in cell wall biosynthesis